MATTTAWAHLPNARHIDAVLGDICLFVDAVMWKEGRDD